MDRPAKSGSVKLDDDGDSTMDSGDESDTTTTGDKATPSTSTPSKKISGGNQKGSPIAPTFTSIGSPQVATHQELRGNSNSGSGLRQGTTNDSSAQEQLRKTPEGDQASAAVKAEGLMDTSENPMKM